MNLHSPPPAPILPLRPPSAGYVGGDRHSDRADADAQVTIVKHADPAQTPPTSNRTRSSTSERPIESSTQDLMDISSSDEEEGEITDNWQQETTDETAAFEREQGDTDEQLRKISTDSITTGDSSNSRRQLSSLSLQNEDPPDANQLVPSVDHTVKSPSPKAQIQGTSQILTMVGDDSKEPVDSPRPSLVTGSQSDEPLGAEVSEDSSDLADSEIYEPPEPIATASTELDQPNTPPLSPVLANATSQIEKEKHLNLAAAQGAASASATFQTVEIPSAVEPVKVRSLLKPTFAQSAHILVGCNLGSTTEDRTLCPLREPFEAVQGISISSKIYLRSPWWISIHDIQSQHQRRYANLSV